MFGFCSKVSRMETVEGEAKGSQYQREGFIKELGEFGAAKVDRGGGKRVRRCSRRDVWEPKFETRRVR
jgi:hypothetical protein